MRVLFFDGVCGLCNRAVDLLLQIDTKKILKFSPLQGELAKKELSHQEITDLNSIILLDQDQKYIKSRAVFRVFYLLGGWWKLLSLFCVLPQFFTDFIYDLVAQNRYELFGKRDSCRLPTPEERERFLP